MPVAFSLVIENTIQRRISGDEVHLKNEKFHDFFFNIKKLQNMK